MDLKDFGIIASLLISACSFAFWFGHLRGTVATKEELKTLEEKVITRHDGQMTLLTNTLSALQRSIDAIKLKLWPKDDPTKD